ncbi:hypothetical protein INR49_002859 [Caranx melampygus]|nr:hypothetical protein INR49_002859 [Caranx melampygus]
MYHTCENYSEMGLGCVSWLSYSVVLQLCLLSPNQCEILKLQERTTELCDPCTVLFVLFIGFTIQRCWKTVLISSTNMFFYYPLPLYFVLHFIGFHADKLHLFFIQNIYFIFEEIKSVMLKAKFSKVNTD